MDFFTKLFQIIQSSILTKPNFNKVERISEEQNQIVEKIENHG